MKRGDIILFIILGIMISACVIFIALRPGAISCVVYENGVEIGRYDLNKNCTERINTADGHYNILEIKDRKASIREADCKNQICVNTAPISKAGEMIICLPHKLSVILEK